MDSGERTTGPTRATRPRRGPPPSRPPVVVGCYLAVPGGAGRKASSPRISLVSLVVVVAILGATAVMLASFNHLVGLPRSGRRHLAGRVPAERRHGGWASGALATVRSVPGVSAATLSGWATPDGLTVNGRPVPAQVFTDAGPIRPAVSRGRAPSSRRCARTQDVGRSGRTPRRRGGARADTDGPVHRGTSGRRGRARLALLLRLRAGHRAATVASTFTALGTDSVGIVLVRYAAGADERRTFEAVATALGNARRLRRPTGRTCRSGRMRVVPVLLFCGLLALVAAAVAHVLIVAVARHRRDLAVLRALGFTQRQSWASVTIHAFLLVLIRVSRRDPDRRRLREERSGPDRHEPLRRVPPDGTAGAPRADRARARRRSHPGVTGASGARRSPSARCRPACGLERSAPAAVGDGRAGRPLHRRSRRRLQVRRGGGLEAVAHAGLGDEVARPRRLGLELAAELGEVDPQVVRLPLVRPAPTPAAATVVA